MQLLIGYLVALSVFLGGGYAGVQWLLAPEAPSAAHAEKSRPESASSRLINAKKIRDARALHRKLAESLAEDGVRPAPARKESDVVVADGEDRSAKTDQPDTPAPAAAPLDAARPLVPETTVAANDPKLDARAEVGPVVTPEKIKAAQNRSDTEQRPAGKSGAERVAARKSAEAKAGPMSEPTAGRSESPINKKQSLSKKKRVERIASSSRKPVMMILRTIEFPDGRREQRLLSMSQARYGLAGYGNLSAFAGDDNF